MKVFLSYARDDGAPFATRLRDELTSARFAVWRDIEALVATDDWREQLRDALRRVDAVIVLLTPAAVKSKHVTIEWENAKVLGKPVIPVRCLPCKIPKALAGQQYRKYPSELIALTEDLRRVQETARDKAGKQLSILRENAALGPIHPAVERLQRWLNAGAYEARIVEATGQLLQQICVDLRPDRSASMLIRAAIEGAYVQPAWQMYDLYHEEKQLFASLLTILADDIRDTSNAIRVPIVLAVMSMTEAAELADATAFEGYPDDLRTDFDELCTVLHASGVGEWAARYGETPQEWRPFANDGTAMTIGHVVESALQGIESENPLIPLFADLRSLGNPEHRGLLRKLRNDGCIVVLDSISMRHPAMQRAFQQSMLDAYPKTSVVNIAPIQSAFDLVRRMRVFLRLQASDLEFQKRRLDQSEEYGGCREIHEPKELAQWLSDRARKMFAPARTRKGIRGLMFNSLDNRR